MMTINIKNMDSLERDIKAFRELMKEAYLHIEISDIPDNYFVGYVLDVKNNKCELYHALDLCYDGIMANGLAPYYE